jgi:elongation factor Ts
MVIMTDEIRTLRRDTGAGMMDCRRALVESLGDREAARLLLKKRGLAEVEKRSERETKEGRVFLHRYGPRAAMAAIGCETDFVARNSDFIATGSSIAAQVCEKRLATPDAVVETAIADIAGRIKENIVMKGLVCFEAGPGEFLETYLHGEGRIGVILRAGMDGAARTGEGALGELLHDLCLHIAAFNPLFRDQAAIPRSYMDEKQEAFRREIDEDEKLRTKAEALREGILAGKLKKHFAAISLLDQAFVKDETISVSDTLVGFAAREGATVSILEYAALRFGD